MATTLITWEIVGGSREWVGPLTVTANGDEVTTFEVAVCEGFARPVTWEPPEPDPDGGDAVGVLVGDETEWELTVNRTYTIFVRYTDNPEEPWLRAGRIKVT